VRVIFLDLDGVLNSRPFVAGLGATEWDRMIDRRAVARLNELVRRSGAKIVITSSWRCQLPLARVESILRDHGLVAQILGATPRLRPSRGTEIQAWLDAAEDPPEAFVILDDVDDVDHLGTYLVLTTWEAGLQDEHVERALEHLGVVS
jgi:hypothetical protein